MKCYVKLLLIGMCVTLLVGCGQGSVKTTHDRAVSISDDRGKAISLTRPAMRIISLDHQQTEALFSLGLNAEIIGVSPDETSAVAKANPIYTYSDDPQKLLAAQPQLVIANLESAQKHAEYINAIENAGIPVACLDSRQSEWMQKLKLLTGRK